MLARVFATVLTISTLAIVGCGSSNTSTTASGLASKSPDEILKATSAALAKVTSYHVEGTGTDKDGPETLTGDFMVNGDTSVKLDSAGKVATAIVVGGMTYIRGNRAFWVDEFGTARPDVVDKLTDTWVKLPASGANVFRDDLAETNPKNLGYCLSRDAGTVSKKGTATVDGRKVVVLVTKGDEAGTSPGELSVALTGPPLPLRVTQTGPDSPGGTPDKRCGPSDSTTTAQDLKFSQFDAVAPITAPAGAIDIPRSGAPA